MIALSDHVISNNSSN